MGKKTYTQKNGAVWFQLQPGQAPYFLGNCVDLDSIPNPKLGGVDLTQCWNDARSGFDVTATKLSPPGTGSIKLTELLSKTASYLEDVDCPFWLHVLMTCGSVGVFSTWERAYILGGDFGCRITEDPIQNPAAHESDDDVTRELSISFPPPRYDLRKQTISRRTTVLTRGLNSISAPNTAQCTSDCGTVRGVADEAEAVEDAAGGASGGVLRTANAGITWTGTAAQPHAVAENVLTVAAFDNGGTVRILAGRAGVAGVALELGYSDNAGAAWTNVVIGATLLEGFTGPKSLFVLDRYHMWCCTTAGNVYFSADGGVTWASQAATVASGGNILNSIHFIDANYGIAVGAADTVIFTSDGGLNWRALAATGAAVALNSVQMFTPYRWIIGSAIVAAGSCLMTFDGGVSYVRRNFTGYANEAVSDLHFINRFIGLLVTNTAGPVGSIHLTKDGGYSWEELTVPTNSGINSVWMCSINHSYAVGEANGGTSLVLNIQG